MQPSTVAAGAAITPAVQVTVQDALGSTVPSSTASITLAITSGTGTAGAVFGGTLTQAAVNGVATFANLTIDKVGTGYTLTATATSLTSATSSAFTVAPGFALSWLTAGGGHTCGLTPVGAAYCWGWGLAGQLGGGTSVDLRTTPVAVSGVLVFRAISGGWQHTCGLTTGGAAYCWGYNGYGEMGDGTTTDRYSPVAVSGDLVFLAISAGWNHTCGLTTSGAAYCWGYNGGGQTGDSVGGGGWRLAPVAVWGGLVFQAISGGGDHTCGLTTGGTAYCWGADQAGQLGDSLNNLRSWPVAVWGGLVFQAISGGGDHTCGLTTRGAAYCWGSNGYGEIGDGTTTRRSIPVAVSGGLVFQAISAGADHTCGLTTLGAAYCWGDNSGGQLGDGTTTYRTSPVAVSGGLVFQAIGTGVDDTCGLTTGGNAYCWGRNGTGALGDGTTTNRSTPVPVLSP